MRLLTVCLVMLALTVTLGCHGKKIRPLEEREQVEVEKQPKVPKAEREAEEKVPPIKPLEPVEQEQIILQSIHFDFDKYNLTDQAIATLTRNAEILLRHPDVRIVIEGHCDERGTDEYNLALGEKRAMAARDFLVRFGIEKSRISIVSYGEERPIDPSHNEEAWARNRRAEFVIR